MFKLDNAFLESVGLGDLTPERKNAMLTHIYATLEKRVGLALASEMSDAQLDEFEGYIDRGDQDGALKWLETNVPDYKEVVASKFAALTEEIRSVAPQILASERGD